MKSGGSSLFRGNDGVQDPDQGRQIVLDDFPHLAEIHVKIVMHQNIAATGNLLPGYLGVIVSKLSRNPLGRFPHNHQLSNYGVLVK